jgi:hypothetical protein
VHSAQRRQPPLHFSIRGNFQVRDARRRSAIRPRDASRIQKEHAAHTFVSRHMGVAVEDDVDIFRRVVRRDMNQSKPNSVPLQVDRERPIEITVAISAHDRYRRTNRLDRLKNARGADVAEMPDFVCISRQGFEICWQFVVRIGQDENFHLARWIGRSAGDAKQMRLRRLTTIERRSARSTDCVC